jgi:hypothetical protein
VTVIKRDLIVAVLLTFCLTVLMFQVLPIGSQDAGDYDPWYDVNDDGTIDMRDIGGMARKFGATGTPINKTEMLLELEARLDLLNATLITILEDSDGHLYTFAGNLDGTPFEVDFPVEWANFSKVEVTATGYKYNTMDSSKQGPLIITSLVNINTDKITFEVWDTNGSPYGGAGWAGNEAHIDYIAFGTQ